MITTYRFDNNAPSMGKTDKHQHAIIHLWWVISIMAVVIIGLTALLCTTIMPIDKRIMIFLSFTATILSIVLSVFAIMYSFYSLQESSRQWSDMKKAVSTIDASTRIISQSTQLLLEQVTKMNKDIGALQGKIDSQIPESERINTGNNTPVNNYRRNSNETEDVRRRMTTRQGG